jgi:hypothetical protein
MTLRYRVSVGIDNDTAQFAVGAIAGWWEPSAASATPTRGR